MAFWTIQGETGKALDASVRDFDAVGAMSPRLVFTALGVDTLSYSVLMPDLVGTGLLLPEYRQMVTLFRNGVRFFTGHCTLRKQRGYVMEIAISGPWWWLERMTLSSLQQDSAGTSKERMLYRWASQSLTQSVTDLLTRAIALGAPCAIGSLAATFGCPQITLSQTTFGGALAELLRLTPDVSGWWDYSVATPTFNTARRSSMTTRTISAEDLHPDDFEVYPLTELQVDFVKVPYVQRATNGKRVFQEQLSGESGTAQTGSTSTTIKLRSGASAADGSYTGLTVTITSGTGAGQSRKITGYTGSTKVATVSPAWTTTPGSTSAYAIGTEATAGLGKVQMLVVSGQELDTYLPDEFFDSVVVKSSAISSIPVICAKDDRIRASGTTSFGVGAYSDANFEIPSPMAATVTDADGNDLPSGFTRWLVKGEPQTWWEKDGIEYIEARLTATIYDTHTVNLPVANGYTPPVPAWYEAVGGQMQSYNMYDPARIRWIWWTTVSVSFVAVKTNWATDTTLYRAADYSFVSPPAGFAEGLRESQCWLPYAGSIAFEEAEAGGTRYRGCKINLANAMAEFATMGALVESETLDLVSGRTTLRLGAPARNDFRTFVDRIRRTSQDNIVFVSGSGTGGGGGGL